MAELIVSTVWTQLEPCIRWRSDLTWEGALFSVVRPIEVLSNSDMPSCIR